MPGSCPLLEASRRGKATEGEACWVRGEVWARQTPRGRPFGPGPADAPLGVSFSCTFVLFCFKLLFLFIRDAELRG